MEAFQALEASFGSMPVAFTVIKVIQDENGHTVDLKFRYLNQAFADLYGRVKEDLLGACFYELFPLEGKQWLSLFAAAAFQGKKDSLHQYSSELKRHLFLTCYPWNETGYCACLIFDETELVVTQKELEYTNYHDLMTRLRNRNCFLSYCEDFQRHPKWSLGAAFLDMNGLKEMNDRYGHEYGDSKIIELACLMRSHFEDELLFRISGDEFVVLSENCQEAAFLSKARAFQQKLAAQENCLASCGYVWEENPVSAEALIRRADQLMYQDKQQYYLHSRVFSGSRPKLLRSLLADLEAGNYLMYLQPKVDLKANQICGAEVLTRYRSTDGNVMLPAAFLKPLEQNHLVSYLDFYMFETACKWLSAWEGKDKILPFRLTVSCSMDTLSVLDLAERLEKIRKRYQVSPSLLSIEIAKPRDMMKREQAVRHLELLRKLHYSVELGGFGDRHTPAEALACPALQDVRLSPALTGGAAESRRMKILLDGMISDCHKMGLRCLAEGIETKGQHELVLSLGADYAQGNYYAEPMTAAEFEDWSQSCPQICCLE